MGRAMFFYLLISITYKTPSLELHRICAPSQGLIHLGAPNWCNLIDTIEQVATHKKTAHRAGFSRDVELKESRQVAGRNVLPQRRETYYQLAEATIIQ